MSSFVNIPKLQRNTGVFQTVPEDKGMVSENPDVALVDDHFVGDDVGLIGAGDESNIGRQSI